MTVAQFDIPGQPSTFATAGERPWKEALRRHIGAAAGAGLERGVQLEFTVTSLRRAGQPFDVDNLCDPVFSVLVDHARWFGGSRKNMRWWSATRRVGATPGCRLTIFEGVLSGLPSRIPVVSAVFAGPLPRHARAQEMGGWARSVLAMPIPAGPLTVALRFGDAVNIGDIATGHVKAAIDCLYPWLGGTPRAPSDHRIAALHVERAATGVAEGAVEIIAWGPTVGEHAAGESRHPGIGGGELRFEEEA